MDVAIYIYSVDGEELAAGVPRERAIDIARALALARGEAVVVDYGHDPYTIVVGVDGGERPGRWGPDGARALGAVL